MSTIATKPTVAPTPGGASKPVAGLLPSRKACWQIALASPLLLGPAWWLLFGTIPGHLGTQSGLVLLLLLVTSTVTDLSNRKVYNWTTYSAFVWALALNAFGSTFATRFSEQLGSIGLQQSLLGSAGCFVVMLFAYSLARGGAGDVKLATAIGALIGFEQGVLAIGVSYILAGAAILLWSVWLRGPFALAVALGRLLGSMFLPMWINRPTSNDKELLNTPIPLAGFFAAGTLIVVMGIV